MGNVRSKKVEGGQGGKRGHSYMTHWESTEEIKASTRVLRRRQARAEVEEQLSDLQSPPPTVFIKGRNRK